VLPFGVFLAGEGWFWHHVSPCVCAWLDCEADQLLGHMWTDLIHPNDQDIIVTAANILQAQERPGPFTIRFRTPLGRDVPIGIDCWIWTRPSGLPRLAGRLTRLYADDATINSELTTGGCPDLEVGTTDQTAGGAYRRLSAGHDNRQDLDSTSLQTADGAESIVQKVVNRHSDPVIAACLDRLGIVLSLLMFVL
jgi:hypothetical protein